MLEKTVATVNLDTFYSFVGDGDRERERIVSLFIEQAHHYHAELSACLEYGTDVEWHDVAHKFKGMTGFVGAEQLYKCCLQAQEGWAQTQEEKRKMLAAIENSMADTIKFFEDKGI
jgi:HPt (histidine-containing phosphotransfer) domain-containing protein